MAEVLATMVVGPLVSMVKEKASSYLLDQYKVMEGMEEQHKLLKRKLPAVLDVVADAEEQAAKHREGAKAWLEDLRKVAYKANDVLDEFKYEALRRKAKAEGHYKQLGMDVIKLFPSHNRFMFRSRMANKLCKILQELDVLIVEMNTFRFEFKAQQPVPFKLKQTDPYLSCDSSDPVDIASESRAKEKQQIVDTLLGQGSNVGLTVLPIIGMGGMGKTKLAQLVYNDCAIQKHFQMRLWVCVSENFDVDSLAKRIVEAAAKENVCQESRSSALDKLQNALSGKRYLLVLDDVWNREANKWVELKSYLDLGGYGSSVLTTTRDKKVAKIMGTIEAYNIPGLDESFIERIIKTTAFSSQTNKPLELLKMVGAIAERCSGSPLAATAIGFALRTRNTVREWEAVLSTTGITFVDEENGILPTLKLSYNCLPPQMRRCFAFCSMFPKDYEIDVQMLIQLWMANCFIPEQQGVCLELVGKHIFNELAQRSFFQEVKQAGFYNGHYSSRLTCKIHDLMHDVAQYYMGNECASIDTEVRQSEDFPYSARHLFMPGDTPETVLTASLEKGSPAIQTLICDGSLCKNLSKYRSVRALKIQQCSLLEPKYLHHLRYLDLSYSDVKALPEDITILYHLQTLNLSFCWKLERLPKAMKYMTALRHLYTDGCQMLESIPAKLGCLSSLQTLTCFVAGTDLGCSTVGELQKLDLGGELELRQLENVTKAEAKLANLGNKKNLEKLTLGWTHFSSSGNDSHKEVLECMRPHDGLKAMRIYSYGGSIFPTWILNLKGMVMLELRDCQNIDKLPALWQLKALRFLYLDNLEDLHCLFSGGSPSKFEKLKSMRLSGMPRFETWWDTDVVQVEEPIFPVVENLMIEGCQSLTALPKPAEIKEFLGCRSAFPALREMRLLGGKMLHSWEEAVQGTLGDEYVSFLQLEELEIWGCPELSTFPEAPKLAALQLSGCSDLFFSYSSAMALWTCFRKLVDLKIDNCVGLVYWLGKVFQGLVSLRTLEIKRCSKLTGQGHTEEASSEKSWPERSGGILEYLEIRDCESLVEVPTLPTSLKNLCIMICNGLKSMAFGEQEEDTTRLVSGEGIVERPDTSSLTDAGSSTANHRLFAQCLESLTIMYCGGLSEVANLPPSIETLDIRDCSRLRSLSSGELPTLEHVLIHDCGSLVELRILPPSLKTLSISRNGSLKSIVFSQQTMRLASGDSAAAGSSSAASSTTVVELKLSSSPNLESLCIFLCSGLSEVANLPPSIKTLDIRKCSCLRSLSAGEELSLLEELWIIDCRGLKSLPYGPHEAYSSLRALRIKGCPGIRRLSPSLQQSLDYLEEKDLDPHLLEGSTTICATLMSKLVSSRLSSKLCFTSRSVED